MKWVRHILPLIFLAAVVGFGLFGATKRQTYPDITSQPDYMDRLAVALLPEEACTLAAQQMIEELPQSPIIALVTPTSDLVPQFYSCKQRFYIQEVYAGEELKKSDMIWITDPELCVLPWGDGYGSLNCGFVNPPQQGQEYLVFLSGEVEIVDGWDDLPTYQLRDDLILSPVLCCNDWNTQVDPESPTYLKNMRWQEFFTKTQQGMDTLMEAKHQVMEQFPLGE